MPMKNNGDAQKQLINICAASVSFVEAAAGADPKAPPRFTMTAYTGGPMIVGFWDAPVVIDLAALVIPSQARPIRFQHDPRSGEGS